MPGIGHFWRDLAVWFPRFLRENAAKRGLEFGNPAVAAFLFVAEAIMDSIEKTSDHSDMRISSGTVESRREFFRTAGRYTLLGLLAAGAALTLRKKTPLGGRCINRGFCAACGVFAGCELPQALSAKQAAGQANPFAYDVDRASKTDPSLVHYEEMVRFPCPQPEPRRIALGPDNQLYVAGKNGLSVLDCQGGRAADIALSSPARCVAVAADGTIYAGLRDHIEVFDRKGRCLAAWDSPGKKAWLTGLAVGEKDLFAADAGNRAVLRYDRSGKLLGRIGQKNPERNVPGLIVPSPYLDVSLAADGLLRVNNPGRHRVEVYTADGDLESSWGTPSSAIEGFCGCCNPIALAPLPDGRLVTCEKGLPRVKIYSAEGLFECVVAGTESFPKSTRAGAINDRSDGSLGGLDAVADARGRIYVLDLVAAEVRVMSRKA